ncbi:MAG: thioredoxin family protein [Promethearchaeota archaeon]
MVQIEKDLVEDNAVDYDTYLKDMKEYEKRRWTKNYQKTTLPEEVIEILKSPSRPINIIVFSGTWCAESALAVPILEKMAKTSDFVTLYIIEREKCPELYEPFMPNGDSRVPVVLFTSEDFYLITLWIERCAKKAVLYWKTLQEMKGKSKQATGVKLVKIFQENLEAFRQATISELYAELVRAVGTVNYSTRLGTALKD